MKKKTNNKNSNVTKTAPKLNKELTFNDGSQTEGFIPTDNFDAVEAEVAKENVAKQFGEHIANLIEFYKPKRKYVRKQKQ